MMNILIFGCSSDFYHDLELDSILIATTTFPSVSQGQRIFFVFGILLVKDDCVTGQEGLGWDIMRLDHAC